MSNHFEYRNGELFAEDVAVSVIAEQFGTPTYIYSRATLERHYRVWKDPLGDRGTIYYAVKSNSNLGVLSILAQLGSGFDIVSGGELFRVVKAGGDPSKVVFSGVGKTAEEICYALNEGIHCFNVESEAELEQLNLIAGDLGTVAPVSLRVNPDVDAKTHPYISTGLSDNKFGIDINRAKSVYLRAQSMDHIKIIGIDCHIGSQLTDLTPYWDSLERILLLVDDLSDSGIELEHIDVGGGLGVTYENEQPPLPKEMLDGLFERLGNRTHKLAFEPGRSISANAGILVTNTLYTKETAAKNFAIVDAAMNDMLRPALYSAYMNITPVKQLERETKIWDVVGPVCESADFIGKDRELAIQAGDLLAQHSAGAYGFGMASNYNSRPRAAEVIVSGSEIHLARERETLERLIAGEFTL